MSVYECEVVISHSAIGGLGTDRVNIGCWVQECSIIFGHKGLFWFGECPCFSTSQMPMFQYESYSEKCFQVHFQDGTSTTEISHFSTPTEIVLRQNNHGHK
jgi:hypothetical protein